MYCRKKSENAGEEILLDVNKMAEAYAYHHVSGLPCSPPTTGYWPSGKIR
ncbi:MAG: hypothetical protein U5N26_02535 [Candidatus Marinimicrobia bacterium]|nr:hypothetical protein [Candidatus Neomarinimicrobiota bacterium]